MTQIMSALLPNGRVLVSTHHEFPPIPDRGMDWSAVVPEYYDEGEPVGRGATEDAALRDLLMQLLDDFPKLEGQASNALEAVLTRAMENRARLHSKLLARETHRDYFAGWTECMSEIFSILEE